MRAPRNTNLDRIPVRRGQQFVTRPPATADQIGQASAQRDTDGNPVPTWLDHSYTYDGSGNLETDTVTGGTDTWVRTYTWTGAALSADSGWVKQ